MGIRLSCDLCGADFSTTLGDYFMMAESDFFTHDCQEEIEANCKIVKSESLPIKIVSDGDDMGVGEVWESATRYTTLAYPATLGDLRKALTN